MENRKNERDQIQYQFTASPLNLMYILDSHCYKMLNLLIQEESYWRSKDKLDGGYFFKSISYLQENMFMANEQDVRLTIEALYVSGLVDVINQGGNRKASKFRINIDKIIEINSMSIKDATNFYPRICKLKRGCVCSYMKRKDCTNDQNKEVDNVSDIDKVSESTTNCTTDCYTDCTPKLDKLYLLNKSDDNINNNNIIINNNNNIAKENIKNESFYPLNTHIENTKDKVDINDQKVIDASARLAVAQPMEPTKKMTKGEQLINKFCQSYKEMKGNEFYENLHIYNIRDLEYIYKMISTLPIKLNDSEKGYIKYYISMSNKKKVA